MSPERDMTVKLCHLTVRVPIIQDEKTTTDLVDQVNAVYDDITHNATKIDTQAFAAQTALYFAKEYMRLQQEARRDHDDMVKALNAAVERLDEMLDEFAG
jgi:hypothetical protein